MIILYETTLYVYCVAHNMSLYTGCQVCQKVRVQAPYKYVALVISTLHINYTVVLKPECIALYINFGLSL